LRDFLFFNDKIAIYGFFFETERVVPREQRPETLSCFRTAFGLEGPWVAEQARCAPGVQGDL
jgi:hypothetical protein